MSAEQLEVNLRGTLQAVTRDGRSGVMLLYVPYLGHTHAVISPDTKGRISIMNQSADGKLKKGTTVIALKVEKGSEALRVLEVALA